MDSKAAEYNHFDPQRAPRLFARLASHLKLPSFKVHIIGTNGKGSVGRFLAQSLRESGYSIMHFTSPHLFDFKERFDLGEGAVSLDALEGAHAFLQKFEFIHEASYFEYATFLALVLAMDCDFLIMEAGVGGEYDSTSVIPYDVTVFTRIGLDHSDLLGDSIESIAITKLRAAQGEIFCHFQSEVVLGMLARLDSLVSEAMDSIPRPIPPNPPLGKHYLSAPDVEAIANAHDYPRFLLENLALAKLVLDYIAKKLMPASLTTSRLRLRGRCEILGDSILLDVGHNEMAALAVLEEMKRFCSGGRFSLIYNSYKNKAVETLLRIFSPAIDELIIFEVSNPRIIDQADLVDIARKLGLKPRIFSLEDQARGVKDDLIKSKKYLVFGSFSLVENFLLWHKRIST